jgi:uncharacterized membrane protein
MPELNLISAGFLLILIGIILLIIGSFSGGSTKVAVGGFIGPLPFGFGNDPEMVKLAVLLTFVIALLFIVSMMGR